MKYRASARSKRVEMVDRDFNVLGTIGFEPIAVKLCPIDFEPDKSVDDEINSLQIAEPDLALHLVPRQSKSSTSQTFGQRFAPAIHPQGYPASFERKSQD